MIIKEVWRSKLGKIGLVLFSVLILTSLYVWATFPDDFGKKVWNSPNYWADYPKNAPPSWTGIFGEKKASQKILEKRGPDQIFYSSVGKTYVYHFEADVNQVPNFLSLSVSDVVFWNAPPVIAVLGHREVIAAGRVDQKPVVRHEDFPLRIDLDPELVQGESTVEVLVSLADSRDEIGKIKFILGGETFGVLGTDNRGRDVFQGILFGLPIALLIALSVSIATTLIGAGLAGISGYYGGKTDNLIQRFIDLVSHFPLFVLLVFLTFVLGPHLLFIVLILIIFGWPGLSLNLRPWVLQIRTAGFIEYCRARGFSPGRIIFRHILTQTLPYLMVSVILVVPSAILTEAGLSFLGLGDPSLPTWGQMLEQSYNTGAVFLGYWWQILPPGLAIIGTVMVFWFIMQAMEPIIEPRLRRGK